MVFNDKPRRTISSIPLLTWALRQQVKRVISAKDARRRENASKADAANKLTPAKKNNKPASTELVRQVPQLPSSLFFQHNEALVPPYQVLVDTNFLSHTVQRKLPLLESMMDLLYAKCDPVRTARDLTTDFPCWDPC